MPVLKCLVVVSVLAVFPIPMVYSTECHLRELDLCLTSAASIKAVPVNDDEIDKYCNLIKEAIECLSAYVKKCATPMQKEVIAFFTGRGFIEQGEKFCTKGDELRNNYLEQAPCLAKAQIDGKRCMNDCQVAFEKFEEVPFQNKITFVCCVYARYKKCSHDIIEATCGVKAVESSNTMIRLLSSNLIPIVCHGFDSNPSCASLLPPAGTSPKNNGKSVVSKLISAYVKS